MSTATSDDLTRGKAAEAEEEEEEEDSSSEEVRSSGRRFRLPIASPLPHAYALPSPPPSLLGLLLRRVLIIRR